MKIGFISVSLLRRSPIPLYLSPRETGSRGKKARWGLWEEKDYCYFYWNTKAGASIWGWAEHRCRSLWPGALISHINPGVKLCPYLLTFRRSNSRERFMPSNQNNVIVLRHTLSRTSAKKFSAMADRCYVAMSYQSCCLVCHGMQYIYWLFISVLAPIFFYFLFLFP